MVFQDPYKTRPAPPRQRPKAGEAESKAPSAFQDPMVRAYLAEYYERQRENDEKATEASNRWLSRKAYLVAYMARNPHLYGSEAAQRDKMANDWSLNDAMDAWSWHTREAARCHAAIESTIRMAQLRDAYPMRRRQP